MGRKAGFDPAPVILIQGPRAPTTPRGFTSLPQAEHPRGLAMTLPPAHLRALPSAREQRLRNPPLHWDTVEEHLEEASAYWALREQTLHSPRAVLATLASGTERRLLAHLDGIRSGGGSAHDRVLRPALEGDDAARVGPAAHVLLEDGRGDDLRRILDMIQVGDAARRHAVAQALKLSARADLDAVLLAELPPSGPEAQAVLLDILDFRQTDAGALLEGFAAGANPATRATALRAARHAPWARVERWVRLWLTSTEPDVRDAAILTGFVHGCRAAWVRCQEVVRAREPRPRLALLALALGGDRADLALLIDRLGEPALQEDALWALGFSGSPVAADALVPALGGAHAVLAAESLVAITGLPPELADAPASGAAPSKREDVAPREWFIPGAVPALLVPWWKEVRGRFAPEVRHLSGRPWTPEGLIDALEHAPLVRRPVLSLELAVRSRRTVSLETGTWVRQQRAWLTHARGLTGQLRSEPFPSLWGG